MILKITKNFRTILLLVALVVNFSLPSYFFQTQAQDLPPIKVGPATFAQSDLPAFAEDQLVVKFKSNAAPQAIEALMQLHGAQISRRSKSGGGFIRLSLPEGTDVLAKADIFSKNPTVEYAHPNYFAQAHFVPNDPAYSFQWHFDNDDGGGVGMEQAWDLSTGSASIIVAVLDTGVAFEDFPDPNGAGCYNRFGVLRECKPTIDEYFQASDLANTNFLILAGSDFVNSDDHPNDDASHGTHVTGTVAQSTNNALGVAGMAFNTTVMPVKVLDANGSGLFDVIADAIIFATDEGADVINMSLGSSFNAPVMEAAVAYAFSNGVVVVASAGNSFNLGNPTNYPAAYDAYVIAVGATQYDETRAPYSSTGAYVDVAAPGGNTSVDQNGDGFADGVLQQTFETNSDTSNFSYWFFQGTSMASPHVAALAALILSIDGSLTPAEVREVIESTAEDKGPTGVDNEYGHGIIDANAALLSVSSAVSITITTDGITEFGILGLGDTQDTTGSGTGDVQTVRVDAGPANLDIKSSNFIAGGNTWTLGAANGSEQVLWEFSADGSTWNIFTDANTPYNLANNVATSNTQDFYLRLTMPTDTASANQHSATVTIVATAP